MKFLDRARRSVVAATALAIATAILGSVPAWSLCEPEPGPNIIVLNSDDYAWPYYGFMQRYLRAKQEAGEHGPAYANDAELSTPKERYGLLLPDDLDSRTPPLHKILTPALDSLATNAAHGQYFPIGHVSASVCKPSITSIATGLQLMDLKLRFGTPARQNVSPVLPEWLIGFKWGQLCSGGSNAGVECLVNSDCPGGGTCEATGLPGAVDEAQYLTMAAGKWRYNPGDHVLDDDGSCDGSENCFEGCDASGGPCLPFPDPGTSPDRKDPWDRELKTGGDSAGSRDILKKPLLGDIKDFIGCALCQNLVCLDTGAPCERGDACDTNPNRGCWPKGCIEPAADYRDDSPRITSWAKACKEEDIEDTEDPRSFFAFFGPFIPHDPFRDHYCHNFERAYTGTPNCSAGVVDRVCGLCTEKRCVGGDKSWEPCNVHSDCPDSLFPAPCQEVYKKYSAYCTGSGNLFTAQKDPDLSACQTTATFPCCPGGAAGPGNSQSCGTPCSNDAQCNQQAGESCRPIDLSCNCITNILEEIGHNIATSPDQGPAKNVFEPTELGNYLRFINTFDRTVDEIMAFLSSQSLHDKTVVLVSTDNGAEIVKSKYSFAENGYRNPFILYDPTHDLGEGPPADPHASCLGQQGCRSELAQFGDLLATIRDTQEVYLLNAGEDPTELLPNPLPRARRPEGYDEARSLRLLADGKSQFDPGAADPARRKCTFPSEEPPPPGGCDFPNPPNVGEFRQCMFGMEVAGQAVDAAEGWYVLAEMMEANGSRHLCKLYQEGQAVTDLYDLVCDPNEQVDLEENHYDRGYCAIKVCDGGTKKGVPCADVDDCTDVNEVGNTDGCRISTGECDGGNNDGDACAISADCGTVSGSCKKWCVGGTGAGNSCTGDGECPGGQCGKDLSGAQRRCSNDPLVTCTDNTPCGSGTCNPVPDEYCRAQEAELKKLLYFTAEKRDWLHVPQQPEGTNSPLDWTLDCSS